MEGKVNIAQLPKRTRTDSKPETYLEESEIRKGPKDSEGSGRAEGRGRQWPGPPRPPAGGCPGLAARRPPRRRPRRRGAARVSVPHARRRPQSRRAERARARLLCGGFEARPACGCRSPARGLRSPSPTCAGQQRPDFHAQVENYRYEPQMLEYSDAGILTDLHQLCSL
ncbi:putative uncharacterized protein DANCR [Hyaena hyaena]|uniref:putative uncharacterized protein DANCR n=1 Tax=Hyaena hyaena TaxID=95912 RepID=UPI001924AD47|nr:putative uncharacterized protein DANCR [Hyaena hyaena]